MAAITLHIHGSGTNHYVQEHYPDFVNQPVEGYNNPPDLFATVTYNEAIRTDNDVTVTIPSANIHSTRGQTVYSYRIEVFAYLTSDADYRASDLPESYAILNKPQGVSRWDSTAYTCSNVSRTITTNSSTVFLQFYVKAWCNNCATDYHRGNHGVLVYLTSVALNVPASGYTITYRGINYEETATIPYQSRLPSSMPTAAEGGITNTVREIDGLTYTFSGWHIPQQNGKIYNWGDPIDSNITIRSVWRISDYTITKDNHLRDRYVARFVGYDATAQVTTSEYVTASRTYHFPGGYIGGNSKPVKQTAFTVSDSVHITQVIGSPTRKQVTDVWLPHYIAYPNLSKVSFTNTGTISPDNSGIPQTYTEVANLTVQVVLARPGLAAIRHHLPFYDENGKLHEMSDYVLDDGSVIQGDWRTATITGNGTITSHWHNPQIWKYRDSGKLYTAENANRGSGWYQDVDLKKFTGGDPTNDSSWNVSNKWKYSEGSWVNCDTDILINR